jgi:hypothetical protein
VIKRKGVQRVGIERVSIPMPWAQFGSDKSPVSITLAATVIEVGIKPFPGHHWIRTGVKFSNSFHPRWGWCNHPQYRGIVQRTALAFGFGGFYLLRMPNHPLIQEDD